MPGVGRRPLDPAEGRLRFVIIGKPYTKKNHQRIIRVRGIPRIAQAKTANAWEESAILQLKTQLRTIERFYQPASREGDYGCNLRALVYRDRNIGDLGNFLAAICDALERAGIVANDRLIGGFDGSRLLIDRERPRVEIELTALTA